MKIMKIKFTHPLIALSAMVTLCALPAHQAWSSCVTAPQGLIGWWPGDNNSKDISGNELNGTGGIYISGEVAQAFNIGGDDANLIKIANSSVLEPQAVTVDAWVKSNEPDNYKWVVSKGARACESPSYGFYVAPTGGGSEIRFLVSNGATFGIAGSLVPGLWDNNWHHIAGTYDGATVTLYVDGILKSSVFYGQNIAYTLPTDNDLWIGGYNYSGGCPAGNNFAFPGAIDEVEIFNRALSQSEIASIYNAGSEGKCKVKTIAIDIKPGSDPNCFNINGSGVIPVALLGANDFNVKDVNTSTLSFNGLKVRARGNKGPLCHVTDVNGDAYPDMVCQFEDDSSLWEEGTSTGVVKGMLLNGTQIKGEDSICMKPAKT